MDNEEMALADFEAAFSEEDGNQTEPAEETTGDEPGEGAEGTETGEKGGEDTATEETGEEGEDEPSEGDDGGNTPAAEDSFTIKVNKEERTVTREEVISLAQKGADYDRVKEQLTQTRQQNQTLLEQAEKNREVLDVLQMLADGTNMPLDQFVDQLHVNFLVKGGKTEGEAREKIRADRAEKQLNESKTKETAVKSEETAAQDRAQREIAEFHKDFPGVELTEELCGKLMADVQSGMSLSNAYRKQEAAKKDAEIAELKRQLEAEKQNKRNRSNSPGSQRDSGGNRSRSPEDEFFAAFEN